MRGYFLGIDIGGTKSHALIADETGQAVGFGEGGPGNHEVVGYDGLSATLKQITYQALEMASIAQRQICAGGFGVAGYDWPSERPPTADAIRSLGLDIALETIKDGVLVDAIVNDAVVGLIAGASEGWGVGVVAGTSNNCRGRDRFGREGRITGMGSWFGEYGGAVEMVMKAVQAVSYEWSRRGPPTRLTKELVDLVHARDVADLLEGLTLEYYHLEAETAPQIFKLAYAGDQAAQDIVRWAGQELGASAIAVIRQLGLQTQEFEVVLAGSLFDGGPMLMDAMRETIFAVAPGARLVRLNAPPVVGGVLLGMEIAGLNTIRLRKNVIETTNTLRKNR